MAKITFYDDRHVYELDGARIPSVSEVLRFGAREVYGAIDQYTLDIAADRGTRVHAACEALDKSGTCSVTADIIPYVEAYGEFLRAKRPRWVAIEEIVYHEAHWYAGRLDCAGYIAGYDGLCLMDRKATSQINKRLVVPQLTGYTEAWEAMGREPVEHLLVLHLRKDGTYRLREFARDPALWAAYLTLHNAFKTRKDK